MPLACRFCLGSSSASPCSVIMENWRCFTVTGQILDGHLDKPGPFGVGEVWTNPQRLRIWLETFPKYTTFLRYRNKLPLSFPSCGFTAPVGSPAMCSSEPSHAHVCAQHRGGSGCPFREKLQEFPGEQQERHSCMPSPSPQHLHLFGLTAAGGASSSRGCVLGQDLLRCNLFKAFRAFDSH